jgi:transcriptional regulator with XRE-family HTH domain
MFVKPVERDIARRLRAEDGLPLREIAERLGVAKSSVSRWVRDVELSPAQEAALRDLNPLYNAQLRGQERRSRSARAARAVAQEDGRRRARDRDPLHIQGCMLYWAEGSKGRNVVAFTNSDADMVALFIRFLQRCYGVPAEALTLRVNCHLGNGLGAAAIVGWWLARLELPASCARTPTINHPSPASRGRRGHVLPYGTAQIRVYSTFVMQSIYGALQEYAAIDRPGWLDLV